MIVQLNHIRKAFLEENIIKDASFYLEEHEKAALVGINGAGKTTLFRIIAGELRQDEGDLFLKKDASFGYLHQISDLDSDLTVYLEAMRSKEHVMKLEEAMRSIEEEIIRRPEESEALLRRHDAIRTEFEAKNGYAVRSEITGILKGLGFSEADYSKPVRKLSGGEKTRLALSKLLVEKPDFLLLDEPTNHLDLSGIRFLESTLASYPGTVLLISHDRYFLDRTVTKIIDLEHGVTRTYSGNYSVFTEKKKALRAAEFKAYEAKKREIEHQEAVIEKLRSFNREKSIRRAESREKLLEKLGTPEKPAEEFDPMRLSFTPSVVSGNDVLSVRDLQKSFGARTLFSGASFEIKRGEKVTLIGDNGTGKTTLFRLINGSLSPDYGSFLLGTNVRIGYYDQEHEVLHPEKTVFDEIHDAHPMMDNTAVRTHLAAFLFTGDDVFKQISELSGGERSRVSLALLMLSDANFLLLDEPTNHLDTTGKEVLEDALRSYQGTVLAISHDRYFINRISTRILELTNGRVIDYRGNYDYYLEKREAVHSKILSETAPEAKQASGEKEARLLRKEEEARKRKHERDLAALEQSIDRLSLQIGEIESAMADPAVSSDAVKLAELLGEKEAHEAELAILYEKWEKMLENS